MIRKCFGGKEKEKRGKKCNFKKKMLSAFFSHNVSEKRSVWVCVCVRVITAEKKVICKKLNLSALIGILGHFKSEFRKKGKW